MKLNLSTIFIIYLAMFFCTACDPQRKSKCEWFFTPFPEGNSIVEKGWVSICVSNFKLGKQKCYFTSKMSFLNKMNGIPFRYTSLKFTNSFPKKVLSVKPCKGS